MRTERYNEEDPYPVKRDARREAWRRFGFMASVAILLVAGFAWAQFRGLREPAAMEAAQMARHLAYGRGWVTDCVRPFDYGYLESRGVEAPGPGSPFPALWTAPGWPWLLSLGMRVAGAVGWEGPEHAAVIERGVIVPMGVALILLSLCLLRALGRSLDDPRVGGVAVAAMLVSAPVLNAAISGLATPAGMLMSLLSMLAAWFAVRRSAAITAGWGTALWTVLSAGAAAVAALTDYALLVTAVAAGALLAFELQRRRAGLLLLYLAVLGLALLPWLMRNSASGIGFLGAAPYRFLLDTPPFPGQALERSAGPTFPLYRMLAAVRAGMAGRFGSGMPSGFGMGLLLGFFTLAMFQHEDQSAYRSFKGITLAAAVALWVLPAPPGMKGETAWLAFSPVVALLGMRAFVRFLDREDYFNPGFRPLLTGVFVGVCALPAILQLLRGPVYPYPPHDVAFQAYAVRHVPEGKMILTDIPWATAWYGDRRSVLLPTHPDSVADLPGGWKDIGGIYLTATPALNDGHDACWALMQFGLQVPDSVPFEQGIQLPAGRAGQLLLTGHESASGAPD